MAVLILAQGVGRTFRHLVAGQSVLCSVHRGKLLPVLGVLSFPRGLQVVARHALHGEAHGFGAAGLQYCQ